MDKSLITAVPFSFLRLIHYKKLKQEEIIKLQNKKLRTLVKHSFDNVPYYNKLFRSAGLRPNDIKTINDLDKIPISKKNDISGLAKKEVTASNMDFRKCKLIKTSGSSGVRLDVYRGKNAGLVNLLHAYMWQLASGDKLMNKHLMIGELWIPPILENVFFFPAKRVSPFESASVHIKEIRNYRPNCLVAMPSSLRLITKEIIDQQINVKIPLIFVGGEKLDNYTRQLAQETFGAEVFEGYGMSEVGAISGECREHNGKHIWVDQVIVEVTRDGRKVSPDEKGNITVTGLNGFHMPFIRYNTEDVGVLFDADCNCGSNFPLMEISEGRISETVFLKDGKTIPAIGVCTELYSIEEIKQFQVIQEAIGSFTIKVVTKNKLTENLSKKITQTLERNIGKVNVEILVVADIARTASGKHKQFISRISKSNSEKN